MICRVIGEISLFWDAEITPEEEMELIKKAAEMIQKYEMEAPAIMMLETFKPLSIIGGQMGRFFSAPFIPLIGDDFSQKGEKFFKVFEKRENLEKLIMFLEEKKKEEKSIKTEENRTKEKLSKKGLRRFLPF